MELAFFVLLESTLFRFDRAIHLNTIIIMYYIHLLMRLFSLMQFERVIHLSLMHRRLTDRFIKKIRDLSHHLMVTKTPDLRYHTAPSSGGGGISHTIQF